MNLGGVREVPVSPWSEQLQLIFRSILNVPFFFSLNTEMFWEDCVVEQGHEIGAIFWKSTLVPGAQLRLVPYFILSQA
jgi:hypothetical protein